MIITDSFVMLNYPKTGSSFAREVVKKLCPHTELILPNIRHPGPPDQHGVYRQIPAEYRGREVVTVVRNPYERFISGYEFRHWAHFPPLPLDEIQARFPSFPELPIDDYVDFQQFVLKPTARIGEQTAQFIQLFFKTEPDITDAYIDSDQALDDLAEITFLRQENLRQQLADFLQRKGYSAAQTAFIEHHEAVNVTVGKAENRHALLTARATEHIADRERLLFRILGAKGIQYAPPPRA